MDEKPNTQPTSATRGEGDRDADRRYREAAERHARSGESEQAAERAQDARSGAQAEQLMEAEQRGKAPAQGQHNETTGH